MAQMKTPSHNDWVSSVLEEMIELEIDLEIEDIKYMKKEKVKALVNEKVQEKAFQYLLEKKASKSLKGLKANI